jgi:tetratricopeptide (TPR) repeat protein
MDRAAIGITRPQDRSRGIARGRGSQLAAFLLLGSVFVVGLGCRSDTALREQEEMRRLALLNYDQAVRHRNEGNDLLALDYFERSALLSPRPATHYEIGRIREQLGEYESALDAYRAALELAPEYQEAQFALLALESQPPPDRSAEEEAARAARIQRIQARMSEASKNRRPTATEVRTLVFPGTEAEAEMPSAIEPTYAPTRQMVLGSPAYHLEHGRRFESQGNWQRAADEYRVALGADPGQLEARLSLGDMMLKLERHARAYAHYAEAVRRFPGSPRPLLKMGNYYDALGRSDLARDYYSQALFLDPRYSEALNNLAALEIRGENYEEAVALLEMAVSSQPEYALPYLNLGIARENSGDREGALAAYRKYVDLGGSRSEEVSVWIAEME